METLGDINSEPSENVWFNAPCISDQTCLLRLTNMGTRRISFTIKVWKNGAFEPQAGGRYSLKPRNGVLWPDEKVLIFLAVNPFQFDASVTMDDRIVIRWCEIPEQGDAYSEMWMLTAPIIRQKFLPILYNP
ncbi:unnamed protein product [Soboliphyme baturini]|uniref:Major sperm protein n=1 Tax=Soboliphyme baturini TaxID=241478 RepID=A0A183J4Z5_9BILA|nr:unnamed protein product [Soboliphyme baturini]